MHFQKVWQRKAAQEQQRQSNPAYQERVSADSAISTSASAFYHTFFR
eukprot:COSAG01_NODE_58580_length_305_cov_0.752427_1_plen_46_part_10